MESKPNSLVVTISKLVSNIFNPLTSLMLYFFYHSSQHYSFGEAVQRFLPILLVLIIPVSGWIIWNVKKGNYSNMDVSNRNQRQSLYTVIAVLMLVFLLVNYMIYGKVHVIMLYLFILLVLMKISNFFIKSSMHTAFNVITAAFFYSENEVLGLAWLGLSIAVGISRILLKRHSTAEVLMGGALGAVVSAAFLMYG